MCWQDPGSEVASRPAIRNSRLRYHAADVPQTVKPSGEVVSFPVSLGSADSRLYRVGALRSILVSRLTGLTLRQLGYWHRTGLIGAHVESGARGYPRLYSWLDYMKLREAAKLYANGVPTLAIRRAVEYLEAEVPNWHLAPLEVEGRDVIARLREPEIDIVASRQGQSRLPLLESLKELHEEGPLGELRRFNDVVDMHPRIRGGSPIVRDTRIETAFLKSLNDIGQTEDEIAAVYWLPVRQVQRALEFERAAA